MMAAVTSGRFEQLDVALGDEIGVDLRRHFAGAVGVLLGEADPLDRGMPRRDFAAEQADAAAADDGEADALGGVLHEFTPARLRALSSAMPEIVSLVSGRSIGSLRSADRSAAL